MSKNKERSKMQDYHIFLLSERILRNGALDYENKRGELAKKSPEELFKLVDEKIKSVFGFGLDPKYL
jgi:hypothetical protein